MCDELLGSGARWRSILKKLSPFQKPLLRRQFPLQKPRFAEISDSVSTGVSTVMAQSAFDDNAAFVSDINFVNMINQVCTTNSTLLFCHKSTCEGLCLHMALYCIEIFM